MSVRLLEPPDGMNPEGGVLEYLRVWIDSGKLCMSVADPLPDDPKENLERIWAMLLSDVIHHVVDAIVLETGDYIVEVRNRIKSKVSECFKSWRDTYSGEIITQDPKEELDISIQSDDAVELIRFFHDSKDYHAVVFVGMWIKSNEEENTWGNIIYDVATMISDTVSSESTKEKFKFRLLEHLEEFIENPTTDSYRGQYRESHNQAGDDNSE